MNLRATLWMLKSLNTLRIWGGKFKTVLALKSGSDRKLIQEKKPRPKILYNCPMKRFLEFLKWNFEKLQIKVWIPYVSFADFLKFELLHTFELENSFCLKIRNWFKADSWTNLDQKSHITIYYLMKCFLEFFKIKCWNAIVLGLKS